MTAFERETGLRMSFDDRMGFVTGVHGDVPAMQLDWEHQLHACPFCLFAKSASAERGDIDCVRNKLAVNRLVARRRQGLEGYCHLGLFDIAEPLIYRERLLGVFYYGSVLVRGTEALAKRRIEHYCAQRHISPKPYLKMMAEATVIEPDSVPQHRETLRMVVRVARFFCEAAGVRPELYRVRRLAFPYVDPEEFHYIVKEAVRYVGAHLDEVFNIKDLAMRLRCHPDFLSRRFKQDTGIDLSGYLQQARIERSKRLLANPKIDIEDAAVQSGFSDRVHFSKVFRRTTGMTPGQYQKSHRQKA